MIRMKAIRTVLDVTQQELCDIIGMKRSNYSMKELSGDFKFNEVVFSIRAFRKFPKYNDLVEQMIIEMLQDAFEINFTKRN